MVMLSVGQADVVATRRRTRGAYNAKNLLIGRADDGGDQRRQDVVSSTGHVTPNSRYGRSRQDNSAPIGLADDGDSNSLHSAGGNVLPGATLQGW